MTILAIVGYGWPVYDLARYVNLRAPALHLASFSDEGLAEASSFEDSPTPITSVLGLGPSRATVGPRLGPGLHTACEKWEDKSLEARV